MTHDLPPEPPRLRLRDRLAGAWAAFLRQYRRDQPLLSPGNPSNVGTYLFTMGGSAAIYLLDVQQAVSLTDAFGASFASVWAASIAVGVVLALTGIAEAVIREEDPAPGLWRELLGAALLVLTQAVYAGALLGSGSNPWQTVVYAVGTASTLFARAVALVFDLRKVYHQSSPRVRLSRARKAYRRPGS